MFSYRKVFKLTAFVCAVTCALFHSAQAAATYDLSRDFPSTSNPAGVWSFGWKSTLGGAFSLLTYHAIQNDPSGGTYEYWLRTSSGPASVYRNAGTNTLTSDGGLGVYPPGIVWFGAGADGQPDNFGVIRFTVPAGGSGGYEVAVAVRTRLDGAISQDADFHVVRNGVEIFARILSPNSSAGYTNVLTLSSGDTIDFMCGRGPDGTEYGGGLKISVTISRNENSPVAITNQPQNLIVNEWASASFAVGASGNPSPTFQWYRDGVLIPQATNATYTIANALISDHGHEFHVVASNFVSNVVYTATSAVAALSVVADTTPPILTGANSVGLDAVALRFSEVVSAASATNLAHYTLARTNGNVTILAATLDTTGTNVLLSVSPMAAHATYTVTVNGVADPSAAGNTLTNGALSFVALPLSILITEFLAENVTGPTDADGEHSDWIELQNQTLIAVDLAGWRLTDEPLNRGKWTFPSVLLQPGQFVVVFASGKDRRTSGAELHTNFKLDGGGEYLALVRPDGTLAQEFTYAAQRQDVSFGENGGTNLFLPIPTPGVSNAPGVLGFVSDTKFTPNRGFFSNAFSLSITSAMPVAEIWFTLNGNVPAPNAAGSIRYTNSLIISNTTTVRAAAFLTNFAPTDVDTHTFIFPASAAMQPANPLGFPSTWASPTRGPQPADYGMDPGILANAPVGYDLTNSLLSLPAISLVAPFDDLFSATRGIYNNSEEEGTNWERETSIELLFPDGAPGFQVEAGLRMHGYSSRYHWFTSKHSFHLNFRDRYGPSKLHFPLFPDTSVNDFDQIVLRGCSTDSFPAKDIHVERWDSRRATYIRDQWMRDAWRDLGHPSSHGRYVHLWLNGLYWGLYNVAELLGKGWAEEYFGGNAEDFDVIKDYFVVDDGDAEAWNELESLVAPGVTTEAIYQRIQGNNPDGTRNTNYPVYLDLPAYVDYILLHINAAADDWPDNNWWSCRRRGPASDGFHFAPWDQEISNYSLTATHTAYGQPFESVNAVDRAGYFYDRLRGYANFRQLFMDRVWFAITGNGPLAPGPSATRWLARQNEIDRAIIAETARWGDSGHQPASTRSNWLNECQWVANFWASNQTRAIQRFRNVNLWPLLGPPALNRASGYFTNSVSLAITQTNLSGTIWFTLDGSDPRAATGMKSPAAQNYSGSIMITNSTRVRVRVTDGLNWSPPIDVTLLPLQALTNLVVTEIHYHPPNEGDVDGDAFEFIELQNRSAFPLSLSGVNFTTGLGFTFTNGATVAPNGFLVLARDMTNFAAKFPNAPLHGVYSGRLDNGGESLALADSLGGIIFNFGYDDATPWPADADGLGFSLQRVTFNSSPSNAAQWIAASPTPGIASPLLDRDGDGLPDAWELAHGLNPDEANGENGAAGDPDRDTQTNLAEYRSGSEPTNALSVLKFDSVVAGAGVTFHFRASSNKTYTIQYTPQFPGLLWSNLVHISARPTNHVKIISDVTGATNRFYRIVTPQQP
jgi:hypothetical protein